MVLIYHILIELKVQDSDRDHIWTVYSDGLPVHESPKGLNAGGSTFKSSPYYLSKVNEAKIPMPHWKKMSQEHPVDRYRFKVQVKPFNRLPNIGLQTNPLTLELVSSQRIAVGYGQKVRFFK